jgi:hypothetical protein
MTPAISVTGLTRRYPDHVALDDVHLTIGTETITGGDTPSPISMPCLRPNRSPSAPAGRRSC